MGLVSPGAALAGVFPCVPTWLPSVCVHLLLEHLLSTCCVQAALPVAGSWGTL